MMVDIVIVNWNSRLFLKDCIASILSGSNYEYTGSIIVIDNNSHDDSAKNLATTPKLKLISNNKNMGFAYAANQGFKSCTSEYCLLLNPDALLLENTLRDCLNYMKENTGIDILGCTLLNDAGEVSPSCARFPTPLRYFNDAVGLSKLAPAVFKPALLMTDWDHKSSRKVDQLMGAFMFMHCSIFDRLGYFDEQFFVYCEELDFSKRLADDKGVSYFNHQIKAVHVGKGTTENVKAFRLFLNLKSRMLYAKKHFTKPGYYFVGITTFIIEPCTRIFFCMLKGQFADIKEVVKGYRLLLNKKIPEM